MEALRSDIEQIIRAGTRAPSGDNIQPWKFIVRGNTILIHGFLGEGVASILEPYYVGHGALIENMVIAAKHFGYEPTVTLLPNPDDPLHTAAIRLRRKEGVQEDPLWEQIALRKTNRKVYKNLPLSEEEKQSLLSVPGELGIDARIVIVEDKNLIKILARRITTQLIVLFSHQASYREFNSRLRWNAIEGQPGDGLDVQTLELSIVEKALMKYALHSWNRAKFFDFFGIQHIAAYLESSRYLHSAAYCAVVMKREGPEAPILGGRIVERLWLKATRMNLSIQPTSATLFYKKTLEQNASYFPQPLATRIEKSVKDISSVFRVTLPEQVFCLVRIGKCNEIPHSSQRREPDITFE